MPGELLGHTDPASFGKRKPAVSSYVGSVHVMGRSMTAWLALLMMVAVIAFAVTNGAVAWISAVLAGLCLTGCLMGDRLFTSADHHFLAQSGITDDSLVKIERPNRG